MELYYEDGVVTQMRIHLADADETVKNKTLIISKTHFKENVHLSYERHFTRNEREVVEEYSNDEMAFYFETERKDGFEICTGFYPDGSLFFVEKTSYNSLGKAISRDNYIHCENGTVSFDTYAEDEL